MQRRSTLEDTLGDVEAGRLAGVSRVVVNRAWWEGLSRAERDAFHGRCDRRGIGVSADDRISRHFVEVIEESDEGGRPPLSSERPT